MLFPKTKPKKKKKIHKNSIMHQRDGTCYLCMKLHGNYTRYPIVHEHHIFGGPNRTTSEQYGLKVYLHPEHHKYGPEAVHGNQEIMDLLHEEGKKAFGREYPNLDFLEIFGKNYVRRTP